MVLQHCQKSTVEAGLTVEWVEVTLNYPLRSLSRLRLKTLMIERKRGWVVLAH